MHVHRRCVSQRRSTVGITATPPSRLPSFIGISLLLSGPCGVVSIGEPSATTTGIPSPSAAVNQITMGRCSDSNSASPADADGGVLRELKEQIARQSQEIATLRGNLQQHTTKSMAATTSGGSGGGAHGGGGPDVPTDTYLALPFYQIAAHRVGWLSLFLCSLSLTALIINGFEHTLQGQLELAYFVP